MVSIKDTLLLIEKSTQLNSGGSRLNQIFSYFVNGNTHTHTHTRARALARVHIHNYKQSTHSHTYIPTFLRRGSLVALDPSLIAQQAVTALCAI